MYESPISFIESASDHFEMEIQKATNECVLQAVAKIGVVVDKEELIKALKYDREQYEKGFREGFEAGLEKYCNITAETVAEIKDDEFFDVLRRIVELHDKLE